MSEMDSSGSVTAGALGGIPATTDVYTAEQVNAIVSGVNDNIDIALCGFTPSGVNDLLVEFYGLIDVVGSGAGIGRTIGSMIVETKIGLQLLSGEVDDYVSGTSGLLNLYSVVEENRHLYDTVIDYALYGENVSGDVERAEITGYKIQAAYERACGAFYALESDSGWTQEYADRLKYLIAALFEGYMYNVDSSGSGHIPVFYPEDYSPYGNGDLEGFLNNHLSSCGYLTESSLCEAISDCDNVVTKDNICEAISGCMDEYLSGYATTEALDNVASGLGDAISSLVTSVSGLAETISGMIESIGEVVVDALTAAALSVASLPADDERRMRVVGAGKKVFGNDVDIVVNPPVDPQPEQIQAAKNLVQPATKEAVKEFGDQMLGDLCGIADSLDDGGGTADSIAETAPSSGDKETASEAADSVNAEADAVETLMSEI